MSATTTAVCVGTSSRQTWSGRRPTGGCQRPVGFAVMGWGRQGFLRPDLTCQAHLGGLVARVVASRHLARVVDVNAAGRCPRCGERPDLHDEDSGGCPL